MVAFTDKHPQNKLAAPKIQILQLYLVDNLRCIFSASLWCTKQEMMPAASHVYRKINIGKHSTPAGVALICFIVSINRRILRILLEKCQIKKAIPPGQPFILYLF